MKIIGEISFPDIFGESQDYLIISMLETVKVLNKAITNRHVYWVRAGLDVNDSDNYLEPLNDPDRNLNLDYDTYCKKYGLRIK